jgi:aminoglycoside phosphotransferase (APT) family kinase protein
MLNDTGFEGLLDVARLERWLGDRLPGAGEPLDVKRITTGASNEMFELRRGGQVWVLRRPPRHPLSPTAHDMAREFRVLSALEGSQVPHARPLALCADRDVIGVPFYLMERIEGFAPVSPLPPPFDHDLAARRGLALEFVDALAALATIDWRAVGLEGFGRPDGFHERQVDRWLGQLARYKTRELPGLEYLAAWLTAHRPPSYRAGIMHGDYHWANVMFHQGGPARMAAVVDWELSTIGDPLLDLGYLLARWRDTPDEPLLVPQLTEWEGLPKRAEVAERYAQQSGYSLEYVTYYIVLSLFKMACVLEGQYYVYVTHKDLSKARFEQLIPDLVRRAEEFARGEV